MRSKDAKPKNSAGTKALRLPPGTNLNAGPRKDDGYVALIRYVRKHRTNKRGGYASPENPRNRRIAADVHAINMTCRQRWSTLELTKMLGFATQRDYLRARDAGRMTELLD